MNEMSDIPQQPSAQPELHRERLYAEVDGLRRQVEQLRQHFEAGGGPAGGGPHRNPNVAAAVAAQMHPHNHTSQQQQQQQQHNPFGAYGGGCQAQLSQQHMSQQQQQHMSQQQQGQQHMSQQQRQQQQQEQQQRRANFLASLPPSMLSGGNVNVGQDNYSVGGQGQSQDDITNIVMLRGKQQQQQQQQKSRATQLAKIMEERRKLHADLETLDRQRQQILEDSGAVAAAAAGGGGAGGLLQDRYSSQLRRPAMPGSNSNHMGASVAGGGGSGIGGPPFGGGGGHAVPPSIIAGARDALQRYPSYNPSSSNNAAAAASGMAAMAAGRNHKADLASLDGVGSAGLPHQLPHQHQHQHQRTGLPHPQSARGYHSPPSPRPSVSAGPVGSPMGRLKRARGEYDAVMKREREEMELEAARRSSMVSNTNNNPNVGNLNVNVNDPVVDQHLEKRRRMMAESALREEIQKRHLDATAGLSAATKPDYGRFSSLFPPNDILLTEKSSNKSPTDTISALSSSHRLLVSQREANLQRDAAAAAQNMLFYGSGINAGAGSNRNGNHNNHNPSGAGVLHDSLHHDRKLPETKRRLSKNFAPETDTVVLGKGNIPKTNFGNLKLKGIVMDTLMEYASGERRKKIAVISRIIRHVTAHNYSTTGFVKFEDDNWWEMTERDARVKITALFRDCLHDQYRSSSSSKVKRRQELRKREITGGESPSPKGGSPASSDIDHDYEEGKGTTSTRTSIKRSSSGSSKNSRKHSQGSKQVKG